MTKFVKPGSVAGWDYPDMVKESVSDALKDAKLSYNDIQQAVVSYLWGETCSGQRALYPIGMTGIPIYNVNNACASGSTALYMAKQFIESGSTDCALAVGFEKMQKGSLDSTMHYTDRAQPVEFHLEVITDTYGFEPHPVTAQMFGNAGRDHMRLYGTKPEHFAKIGYKNHKHSVNNPRSQFQKEYSLEEILKSPMIHDPLTKLQCCPTSDGSAAAILCSENFLRKHPNLKKQAVEMLSMALTTDLPSAFKEKSNIKMVGFDAAKKAADQVFTETRLSASDVDVIELHDCFSANELITYEALGLCKLGEAGQLIDRGDNTYGGKWVVNPSGGLISKGHPIGATGVAQCAELNWQLRGEAGRRQVQNARLALQHNIGIGGAAAVGLYKLAFPEGTSKL
jgi:sterol carrier protein 2